MNNNGSADSGGASDLPWASVFDPSTNIRALGEIQARGFRAATEVVNRFVQMADRAGAAETAPAADRPPQSGHQENASGVSDLGGENTISVDRVMASWQNMIGELARSLRGTWTTPGQRSAATVDFVNSHAAGQVTLRASEPGAVSTEVWLHNGGADDLGKVQLRCSDLLAHDGSVVESASVRFEPDTVPMVARSSRGVTVEVDISECLPPGCYRGTLLADGHPDVWLPVVLTIDPQV